MHIGKQISRVRGQYFSKRGKCPKNETPSLGMRLHVHVSCHCDLLTFELFRPLVGRSTGYLVYMCRVLVHSES